MSTYEKFEEFRSVPIAGEITPGDIVAVSHDRYGRKEGLVVGSFTDNLFNLTQVNEIYQAWYPTVTRLSERLQRRVRKGVDLGYCAMDMCDLEGYEDDEDNGDADVPGEMDEEMTIQFKSAEEQKEIQLEIASLSVAVPQLSRDYKVVDRLGTGTFSSVYKAIDLCKVFVAIKRIYVTSNPERIRNEISIMEDCRGTRHTCQLITAFRNRDQVVAIMPYNRNEDFRDFFMDLSMAGIKTYFRCMFRALRDVHARGVIHRDVKPANFLFDPQTGIGTLCDFGLASRMDSSVPTHGACLHTPSSREFPHGKIKSREEYDVEHLKKAQKEARQKSSWSSDKVGYPEKDTRPHSKANRAGTRGFRAPEVLFKCGSQTGAIDVWSAGTILLFFLTRKFPLFQSSDDIEALMEIATIIGRQKMEKAAILHSRSFATNVPSLTLEGTSWREFVEKQNPELMRVPHTDPRLYPYNMHQPPTTPDRPPPSSSSIHSSFIHKYDEESHRADVANALSLLKQLMEPESHRRITPRGALYHPFLADPSEPEDDELFPHPSGEGVAIGKERFYEKNQFFKGESIIETVENVKCNLTAPSTPGANGSPRKFEAAGTMALTDQRLIWTNPDADSSFKSLTIPLPSILSSKFEQPIFGANHLVIGVKPTPGGDLTDGTTVEIRFSNGAMFRFVSILEKTRERAIFMRRRSVEDEEHLPEYTSPSTSSADRPASYPDLPPGYDG
ncbi:kinase-like domain-containing protein, partial [Chiua virens]